MSPWRRGGDADEYVVPTSVPHTDPIAESPLGDLTEASRSGAPDAMRDDHYAEVCARLAALEALFAERLRNDQLHEQQIQKLYTELDTFKSGERQELLLTLVRGVLLVLDDVPSFDSGDPGGFDFLVEKLNEALLTVDVQIISDFDIESEPTLCQVVGFLDSTSSVDVEVARHGYRFGERVLRRREVRVRSLPPK